MTRACMGISLKILGFLWFAWILSPSAFAGDCSAPDDCEAPRDNAPKAAGGAAVATAIALALRGLNGSDEDQTDEGEDIATSPELALKGEGSPGEDKSSQGEDSATSPDLALKGDGSTTEGEPKMAGSDSEPDPIG